MRKKHPDVSCIILQVLEKHPDVFCIILQVRKKHPDVSCIMLQVREEHPDVSCIILQVREKRPDVSCIILQVREKYPHLENRQVTKILGEWWADLEPNKKTGYQELARQLKEAFLRANPDFKWYKIPSQPPRPPPARPSNQKVPRHQPHPTSHSAITFGKLAGNELNYRR